MDNYKRPSLDKLVRHVGDAQHYLAQFNRSVLVALLRIAEEGSDPDGYPSSSVSASPQLARAIECSTCEGSGQDDVIRGTEGTVACPDCGGSGKRWVSLGASGGGLRTRPEDPRRRKREHGYQEDSSTEQAVLSRQEDHHADPILASVIEACTILSDVQRLMRRADRLRQVVMHVASAHKGREDHGQGICLCCGSWVAGTPQDRLKRGLCNACWVSWCRWKLTNRVEQHQHDAGRQFAAFVAWRRERGGEEWRIDEVDRLRERGELPPAS